MDQYQKRTNRPRTDRPRTNNQIIVESNIRVSASGAEMLDFEIPLGIMKLHVSCTIPEDGTCSAPVYIHIHPTRNPSPNQNSSPRNARAELFTNPSPDVLDFDTVLEDQKQE